MNSPLFANWTFLEIFNIIIIQFILFCILFIPGYIWVYFLFRKYKITFLERVGLSFGFSIAIIPQILLWLNFILDVKINSTNSFLIIFISTLIPIIYTNLKSSVQKNKEEIKEVKKTLKVFKDNTTFSLKKSFLWVSSLMLIIIGKLWIPFSRQSLVRFSSDVPRHMFLIQLINKFHMLPRTGTREFDVSIIPDFSMIDIFDPSFHSFNTHFHILASILHQITKLNIMSIMNFLGLLVLILSILSTYMLGFIVTKDKKIGLLSCIIISIVIVTIQPSSFSLSYYVLIPFILYNIYIYLYEPSFSNILPSTIFIGALFVNHALSAVYITSILLIITIYIVCFKRGKNSKIKALNVIFLINMFYVIIIILSTFFYGLTLDEFVRYFFSIWAVPTLSRIDQMEILTACFLGYLFSSTLICFQIRRIIMEKNISNIKFKVKILKYEVTNMNTDIFFIIIILLLAATMIWRFTGININAFKRASFYFELQRDMNVTFSLMSIIALFSHFIYKKTYYYVFFLIPIVPFLIGFSDIILHFPSEKDTIVRMIYYSYIPMSILAALVLNHIEGFIRRKIKNQRKATTFSFFAFITLFISMLYVSMNSVNIYYKQNEEIDLVNACLWLKKQTEGEDYRIVYDSPYVLSFILLNPEDYIPPNYLKNNLKIVPQLISEKSIDYIITNHEKYLWEKVLNDIPYSIVYSRVHATIYKIEIKNNNYK